MSKEMLELNLQIYTILTNKFKKELQENSKQVKVLWSKQINLSTIKLTNSIISDEYRDFTELFTGKGQSIRRDSFSTSTLRSQDTYYRRQNIREDINLFTIIREARDTLGVSR